MSPITGVTGPQSLNLSSIIFRLYHLWHSVHMILVRFIPCCLTILQCILLTVVEPPEQVGDSRLVCGVALDSQQWQVVVRVDLTVYCRSNSSSRHRFSYSKVGSSPYCLGQQRPAVWVLTTYNQLHILLALCRLVHRRHHDCVVIWSTDRYSAGWQVAHTNQICWCRFCRGWLNHV